MPTAETVPPGRTPEGAWLDEGGVSPEWAPPAGDPVRRSWFRGPVVYGSVLLALVLVLGLVYATGGFGHRTDLLTPVPPGTLITTGPFEISFTEATAQAQNDSDGKVREWEVVAVGQARNTGEESLAPTVYGSDGVFAMRVPATGQVVVPAGVTIGDDPEGFSILSRSALAPGLPPTGYRLTFTLPPDFVPGPSVNLAVAELAYEAKYLVSDEKAWDNTQYGWRMELPLRVLPAKT